jgi:D-glycero-alpha-D-manno-heptose-7-phosphate kinase
MIGTRTPFRISFAGGGSDLKEFYSRHAGCVLSTTIDKYMYIFVHPYFDERIQVKYSRTELVGEAGEIKHPIVREALRKFGIRGIDVNAIGDIPAGTGLGSSGSFTVGLLNALHAYTGRTPDRETLAREACAIEIDILVEPIGKQDQYAAAYGGLNLITFHPDDNVCVKPVVMSREKHRELENNLLFFYTGGARPAREILSAQKKNTLADEKTFMNIQTMTGLAQNLKTCLEAGALQDVGAILDEGWRLKKELSPKISHDKIDYYYQQAYKNGAAGGKLLGAGGRGFLMFYCEPSRQAELRQALKDLREFKFKFDNSGTKVIYDTASEVNSDD